MAPSSRRPVLGRNVTMVLPSSSELVSLILILGWLSSFARRPLMAYGHSRAGYSLSSHAAAAGVERPTSCALRPRAQALDIGRTHFDVAALGPGRGLKQQARYRRAARGVELEVVRRRRSARVEDETPRGPSQATARKRRRHPRRPRCLASPLVLPPRARGYMDEHGLGRLGPLIP